MTAATVTATKIGQARAIRREVMETRWPPSREAQWAIGWKLGELDGILAERDRLVNGDLHPYGVRAPDMGPDWDLDDALEYVDDQALQCAEGLRKRLAEKQQAEMAGL